MVSLAGPESQAATDWPPPASRRVLAWRDIVQGFRRHWIWTALAFQDIKLRYRGSVLGPFWLTISTLVMVVSMGFIYAHLFHTDLRSYMPYLTVGLIVWGLIATLVAEGCQTFLASGPVIQQVPIPFSIHAYRVVYRNFIVFAHTLVIVPIGLLVFAIPVDWHLLEAAAGCVVLAVNGVWVCIFLGTLSARFRDIVPIVASFLQAAFFLTPVFWPIEALGIYRPLAELNPFFAAIDVVRAPLIGVPVASYSWPVLLAATALGCGATFLLFARYRGRIAYWV
jgi:ABC-2 type transport system permease protein/lipopolysaccharide transport system permease protein